MPLNSLPPTTTADHVAVKQQATAHQLVIDCGLYGGVVPGNHGQVRAMLDRGVRGFKCFLIDSGVPEFPMCTELDVRQALAALQGTSSFLMFHAELDACACMSPPSVATQTSPSTVESDPRAYSTFLASRPDRLEQSAIDLVITLCDEYQVPCHIVHLSSAAALPRIRAAKDRGVPLTVETTFHYLFFSADQITPGRTEFKCCPPIRDRDNARALWRGLLDGTIDFVVSDHSPCTPDLKLLDSGDFMKAWGGIASVQFGLPLLWTAGQAYGISYRELIRWLCEAPARRVGLEGRKGSIRVGADADFVLWNPDATFKIMSDGILFKNKVTPYEGVVLRGLIQQTILRGCTVFDREQGGVLPHRLGQLL